jgi:hypothetical protein
LITSDIALMGFWLMADWMEVVLLGADPEMERKTGKERRI